MNLIYRITEFLRRWSPVSGMPLPLFADDVRSMGDLLREAQKVLREQQAKIYTITYQRNFAREGYIQATHAHTKLLNQATTAEQRIGKLSAALRSCLKIVDAHRRFTLGEGDLAAAEAREALNIPAPRGGWNAVEPFTFAFHEPQHLKTPAIDFGLAGGDNAGFARVIIEPKSTTAAEIATKQEAAFRQFDVYTCFINKWAARQFASLYCDLATAIEAGYINPRLRPIAGSAARTTFEVRGPHTLHCSILGYAVIGAGQRSIDEVIALYDNERYEYVRSTIQRWPEAQRGVAIDLFDAGTPVPVIVRTLRATARGAA